MDEKKHWSLFTLGSSGLTALMVFTLVVTLPLHIQIIGGIIGTINVAVWGVGMFEGDVRRLKISIALTALLFTISLLDQIWTRVVVNEFPTQLLAFILILFNVETIPLVSSHRRLHFGNNLSRSENLAKASWKIIWRKISTFGILFSGCYVLTLTTIYIGFFVYSFAPIIGDTSIYLVAVFVLLALFITLREGSPLDHEYNRDSEAS